MHDIWNPWHGCTKISEGCKHCYMYYLDAKHGRNGAEFYPVKGTFDLPLQKDRSGQYKIKSGERIRVCMTSDFFVAEGDELRPKIWDIIRQRPDLIYIFVTKRPERVAQCLPKDLDTKNFWFHVTCENQRRLDERAPILLDLPFEHKGIMAEPFLGELDMAQYLASGQIENVWAGGENYGGSRPLKLDWVIKVSDQCKAADVSFTFFETGNRLIRDGKFITFTNKIDQNRYAYECGLNYQSSRPQHFDVPPVARQIDLFGEVEEPFYQDHCQYCLQRSWCTGCRRCGRCESAIADSKRHHYQYLKVIR